MGNLEAGMNNDRSDICERIYHTCTDKVVRCQRKTKWKHYDMFNGIWVYRCGLHKRKGMLWERITTGSPVSSLR